MKPDQNKFAASVILENDFGIAFLNESRNLA